LIKLNSAARELRKTKSQAAGVELKHLQSNGAPHYGYNWLMNWNPANGGVKGGNDGWVIKTRPKNKNQKPVESTVQELVSRQFGFKVTYERHC